MRKVKKEFNIFNLLVGLLLLAHALVLLILLAFLFSTSLKSQKLFDQNFFAFPDFQFSNFSEAIKAFKFQVTRGFDMVEVSLFPEIIEYTILYTLGGAFVSALVPCLVSYVVAKFPGVMSKILSGIVIVTMMVPIVGNQPAMIDILFSLNLYDSILGALAMRANFLGMYFLIYVAAFSSLSDSYREAAYIDGASEWTVMLKIMFPLVKTIFLTVLLIQFVDCWNDYSIPLLYLPSHPTIAYGVYYMSNTTVTGLAHPTYKMASCMIMVIPTVTLFIIFRDRLMGNLSMGGIKG